MTDNEKFFDEEIGPVLAEIGKKCEARGMAIVATVEYDPGEYSTTAVIPGTAPNVPMRMAYIAAHARGNVDSFMISLMRWCGANGVDTSQSIFMRKQEK